MVIEKTPQDYFKLFHGWAEDRGIYKNSTALAQSLKGNSESGEMCDAVIKGDRDGVLDGIGDTCVCLYNTAVLAGVSERITVGASVSLVDDVQVIAARTHREVADVSLEVAAIHSFQFTRGLLETAKADLSGAIDSAMRCLCKLAEMHDSTITECMALAWEEIKDRRGFLNSDGVFVKECDV